jgi:hypothetical protein
MPAEGEPIGSCGGAPGNEPAYPRPGARAHETDPNTEYSVAPRPGGLQPPLHCPAQPCRQLRPAGARGMQGVRSALSCWEAWLLRKQNRRSTKPHDHLRALWCHGEALGPM